jgi:hypothetical protein
MEYPSRRWCARISSCIILWHDGIIRAEWKNKEKSSQRFSQSSRESSRENFRMAVTEEREDRSWKPDRRGLTTDHILLSHHPEDFRDKG